MSYYLNWATSGNKYAYNVQVNGVTKTTQSVELINDDIITFRSFSDEMPVSGTTYYPTDNITITDSDVYIGQQTRVIIPDDPGGGGDAPIYYEYTIHFVDTTQPNIEEPEDPEPDEPNENEVNSTLNLKGSRIDLQQIAIDKFESSEDMVYTSWSDYSAYYITSPKLEGYKHFKFNHWEKTIDFSDNRSPLTAYKIDGETIPSFVRIGDILSFYNRVGSTENTSYPEYVGPGTYKLFYNEDYECFAIEKYIDSQSQFVTYAVLRETDFLDDALPDAMLLILQGAGGAYGDLAGGGSGGCCGIILNTAILKTSPTFRYQISVGVGGIANISDGEDTAIYYYYDGSGGPSTPQLIAKACGGKTGEDVTGGAGGTVEYNSSLGTLFWPIVKTYDSTNTLDPSQISQKTRSWSFVNGGKGGDHLTTGGYSRGDSKSIGAFKGFSTYEYYNILPPDPQDLPADKTYYKCNHYLLASKSHSGGGTSSDLSLSGAASCWANGGYSSQTTSEYCGSLGSGGGYKGGDGFFWLFHSKPTK